MFNKVAIRETAKFIVRTVLLVGLPAVLSAVVAEKPEWGTAIGFVLVAIDKYVHKLPNSWTGIVPF